MPNDSCANAIAVSCGDLVPFDTTGATEDGPAPTCGFGPNNEIWYSIVGNGGNMTFSTCNIANFDTRLLAREGCGGTEVICNDDAPGCGLTSEITFLSANGTPYVIGVGGFNGAVGQGDMIVTCDIPAELTGFEVE